MGAVATKLDEAAIMAVLENIPDPEIPVLTITDLGIVRGFADDPPRVRISPTYTGCPATVAIETVDPRGARQGRISRKCISSGCCFRPGRPSGSASAAASACTPMASLRRARRRRRECPQCGSTDTEEVSRFGATPCKAQWRCKSCLEPFERFKCH